MDANGRKISTEGRGSQQKNLVFGEYEPRWSDDQLTKWQLGRSCGSQNSDKLKADPWSKPRPSARHHLTSEARTAKDDWLTLEDEELLDLEQQLPMKYSPAADNKHIPASQLPAKEDAAAKADPLKEEEEDWLIAALARKKAQAQTKAQERKAQSLEVPGKGLDRHSTVSQTAAFTGVPQQAAVPKDKAASTNDARQPDPRLSAVRESSAKPSVSAKTDPSQEARPPDDPVKPARAFQPAAGSTLRGQCPCSQASKKSVLKTDFFSKLFEEGIEFVEFAAADTHLQDSKGCLAALFQLQTLVSQLERQVHTMEVHRTQQERLLDFLHQRHQEDLGPITHGHRKATLFPCCDLLGRSQKNVVENKDRQQEDRLHLEREQPTAQFPLRSQDTAPAQQNPKSQEQGKLLKELPDQPSQQQRDMKEERKQFQEMIGKLEARVREQTQLLEQERWKTMVEKDRAESLQRSLEEQQKFMMQQLSTAREEMEKAKKTWLEEKILLLQKCSERGKWTAECAAFHNQERLMEEQADLKLQGQNLRAKQEQLERYKEQLQRDKKQMERDKEKLEKSWQELRLKKEKVERAKQYIQQREKKLKSMTEHSCQKYEEGERALWEARWIESEHQERLRTVQRQMEQLRQHRELLHQDRLSMAQQRRQLEQLRNEVSRENQKMLLTEDQSFCAPKDGVSCPQCRMHPQHCLWGSRDSTASSIAFSAMLQMLKHKAQMDHDFLEDEHIFLDSLKKAPHHP